MKLIQEDSKFRLSWDIFILILVLITCIIIPFQLAFAKSFFYTVTFLIYILDLLFILDIYLNFNTSFKRQGVEEKDRRIISKKYLKFNFYVDLLAVIPFELILLGNTDLEFLNVKLFLLLRIFRLFRIIKLFAIFNRWEKFIWTNSGYLRIIKFGISVIIFIHIITCAWLLLPSLIGYPENSWIVQQAITGSDNFTKYIRSLYWTITTMTTVGYGDITPNINSEYLFTSAVMLMGASLYAIIIGNIAGLFSNLNSEKIKFWNRYESISDYLKNRKISFDVIEKVRDYYSYLWDRHKGVESELFLNDLSSPLKLEVMNELTSDLQEKVLLFKYCSDVLRNELLVALKPQTHAPGSNIVNAGEIGKEIFFITKGTVEILSADGNESYGHLEEGDYFGVLSLVMSEPRTAYVRTNQYCELFVLSGVEFHRLKKDFPEFSKVLKAITSEKTEHISSMVIDGIIL
ncbi:ion transporter [Bacteroidota bacterium]